MLVEFTLMRSIFGEALKSGRCERTGASSIAVFNECLNNLPMPAVRERIRVNDGAVMESKIIRPAEREMRSDALTKTANEGPRHVKCQEPIVGHNCARGHGQSALKVKAPERDDPHPRIKASAEDRNETCWPEDILPRHRIQAIAYLALQQRLRWCLNPQTDQSQDRSAESII
jgi:hypothetical protein